jgi:hypothetical protein
VLTDAPEIQLDMVVDMYDGWLDADDEPAAQPPLSLPLPLPEQPKRLKRGDG